MTPQSGLGKRKFIPILALGVLVLVAVLVVWKILTAPGNQNINENATPTNGNKSSGPPALPTGQIFSYSVKTWTCREGESTAMGDMFGEMGGAIRFKKDDCLRFKFVSPEKSYLYLLNESPEPMKDGRPLYRVMFPSSADNDSSALIEANQLKQVPKENPIGFGGSTGMERVWIIWSANPVEELEAVKKSNNPNNPGGMITGAAQIDKVKIFLDEHSIIAPQVTTDESNRQTKLHFTGDLMVHLLKLEHR